MRIAINARLLLANRMEGIATYTLETCQRMIAEHPEDEFFFFFDRKFDPALINRSNVHMIILHPQARHPLLWHYWFEYALSRALIKHQINVLYSPEPYLSLRSQVPGVMVTHDLSFLLHPEHVKPSHLRYFKKYIPQYHDHAKHIITVSHASKADLIRHLAVPEEKITVAHNAVRKGFAPLDKIEKEDVRQKLTGGHPYIIYLGSIHPRKNVAQLIRAFEIFCSGGHPEHRLVLYGRWAFQHSGVQSLIHSSRWRENIVMISDNDIAVENALAAAECLCYVSLYEGFGLPLIEAMQCGVAVISSLTSSMPEVCGDAALLVHPENVMNIAEAMTTMIENKTIRERLISRGYENIRRFSWDKTSHIIYKKLKHYAR